MPKRVILSGMITPYQKDMLRPGDQVWACNGAFRDQYALTRVYSMDDPTYFPVGYVEELSLLPKHVRVICTEKHDCIPNSEAYPIHEILDYFHNHRFFNSTFAYMLAAAIYEGFDEIVMNGCYWKHDSWEYMSAMWSMNFWCGVAVGKGIKLGIHGPCMLCQSPPWEPDLYGYVTNEHRHVLQHAMAVTFRWAGDFPAKPVIHHDIDAKTEAEVLCATAD